MPLHTHEAPAPVLYNGPALVGLQENGHDPLIVSVVEVFRDVLLLVHFQVRVGVMQGPVHLLQPP